MACGCSKPNCGCSSPAPVLPENLTIVPAGSMIVQAPCGEGCAPPSSAALSAVQPVGGQNAGMSCDGLRNPCVTASFVVPAIGKTGSFYAACASSWAVPGLQLYFAGLGYLEVIGVSGTVITYRNLSMESGTQILEGTCFPYGAPTFGAASDEDSGENEASTELDAIYGEDGNVEKKILPVNGTMLFACGDKWIRRQGGLMFFPVTLATLVNYSGAAGNQSFTPTLSNKPTNISCSQGLWAQLRVKVSATSTTSNLFPTVSVAINSQEVAAVHAHPSYHYQFNDVMIDTANAATLAVAVTHAGSPPSAGTMTVKVDLLGYWH